MLGLYLIITDINLNKIKSQFYKNYNSIQPI